MRFKEWDNYIDSMVKHVKFTPDRRKIRREFGEHMEDMFDDYVSDGMSEDEAKEAVMDNIGDSTEVGELMNMAHNAVIGWIWQGMKVFLVITMIICAVPMYTGAVKLAGAFSSWITGYEDFTTHGEAVRIVPIDEKAKVDDHTLLFDELIEYEDGVIEVRYREKVSFLRSNHIKGVEISVRDDKSRELHAMRSDDHPGSRILEYRQELFKMIRDDCDTLIIYPEGEGRQIAFSAGSDLYMKRYFEVIVDMTQEEGGDA